LQAAAKKSTCPKTIFGREARNFESGPDCICEGRRKLDAEAALRKEVREMAKKGKGTVVALAEQLIAGTSKHLASLPQIKLAGGSFTPSQIIAQLQTLVTLRSDVDAAKASTKAKLAVEKANMPALRILMSAFVTFVKAAHGTEPDVLADFGLHPKARTQLTVEAKTAAVAKRTATRAARHTTGPKQKKGIKGAVTGIVVTPVTAKEPVATAAPSGPSAPATSTGTTAASTPHTTSRRW
jgi:hypothetical protein